MTWTIVLKSEISGIRLGGAPIPFTGSASMVIQVSDQSAFISFTVKLSVSALSSTLLCFLSRINPWPHITLPMSTTQLDIQILRLRTKDGADISFVSDAIQRGII